jgi:hypothetical protein
VIATISLAGIVGPLSHGGACCGMAHSRPLRLWPRRHDA